MRVTVLGSASGISMPGRAHASVAVECRGGLYLFDLGEPVGRELLARGLPVADLKAAFVSHMHSDHVGGLFQFVKNLHLYHNHPEYLPQVDRIAIGIPAEAVAAVRAFLVATYMLPERMRVKVDIIHVRRGRVYDDGNVTVTAHPTTHLAEVMPFIEAHPEYRSLRGEAYSYDVSHGGKRTFYSGDLGSVSDIVDAAGGADLVVLEFGHLLPLEDNLARLKGLGIGKVLLTHIFPDYNDRPEELQRIADAVLPGIVTVARDGTSVEI